MKYRLYTTSQKAWDGMFKAMASAQKSIYLEMYIFLDDTQATHDFLGLLKAKAKAGVEVAIIADAFGSSSLRQGAAAELRAAGAEFIFFSHWLKHLHRKILIIDERVAFIGGVNIEETTRHWRDIQLRLTGRIVKPLLRSFAQTYKAAGGKKEALLVFARRTLVKRLKAWVTETSDSPEPGDSLNRYYSEHIKAAQQLVQIATPYLLPPRRLLVALDDAVRRGVKVEIVIPNDTDIKIINKVNYLNACRLADLGVKVFLLPFMNHAKLMLIDGREGVVGSQNMDVLSFNFNLESGVFFEQKDLTADLEKIFTTWQKESIVLASAGRRLSWRSWLLMGILKLFYPIF